jgi:hypothetical protein
MKRIWNVRFNVDEFNAAVACLDDDGERVRFLAGLQAGLNGKPTMDKGDAWVAGWGVGNTAHLEAVRFSERQRSNVMTRYHGNTMELPRYNHGATKPPTTVLPNEQSNNLQSTIQETTIEKPPSDADGTASGGKRFAPPSVAEVADYCRERRNCIDPQSFCDFYEARGWVVGKSKMKSWQAAVRTWENRRQEPQPPQPKASADEWRQETLAEREARIRSRGPLPTREEIATMFPDLVKHFEDMKAK